MAAPDPQQEKALARVRSLAHLLDDAIPIPGTKYRVGLDPLLGLFPALGDYLSAILSAYIIWQAARVGTPRETLARMGTNVLVELVLGAVPVLGDTFDVVWKANARNLELLEAHLSVPATTDASPQDRRVLWLLLAAIFLVTIVAGAISLAIALALLRLLGL